MKRTLFLTFAHLVWKPWGCGRLNYLFKGRECSCRLRVRSLRLALYHSPCCCAHWVLCTCRSRLISETRSQHHSWVSSGREATIKGSPLTHVFAGSLESFAVPLLTLLQALCGAALVFGQPADTWVIIQRGVPHGGPEHRECVYLQRKRASRGEGVESGCCYNSPSPGAFRKGALWAVV